ncbi:MAG: hypothetical protein H0T55_00955 [Rubrobacteraceae bacterium]|nr:hypothetical protein [Rubrobacteraceae bacterium]MBA3617402.1 hypothetical protein [Rubrobacteraceae bacterium]MDQ3438481.1 hypothetical protein [Actinomycetota bacterium]
MAEMTKPDIREWRRLYEATVRVKEISPWEWMTEADVFGVQNPETGELGFVSVMGMLGEHYAVSLYLGSEGIHGFLDLQTMGPFADPEDLIQIPQLQASFEDREQLDKRDREVIKELGLKFRGRNAWPWFRSYRTSFFPWFLESGEASFLTVALEQLADVAPRFMDDSSLLEPFDGEGYLLRAPRREGEMLLWEDASTGIPPLDAPPIEVEMEESKLEALGRLPRRGVRLEVDFFMIPAPVQDEGDRPYFPHMLLTVDTVSGMILGSELLKPFPSQEAMWGSVPENLADQLSGVGLLPEKVSVDSDLLFQLLEPLAGEVGFELELSPSLPGLDTVREDLLRTFGE